MKKEDESKTIYGFTFSCPVCHGTYFGTGDIGETPWVRQCHDELGVRCRWEGTDGECMVSRDVAAERIKVAKEPRY